MEVARPLLSFMQSREQLFAAQAKTPFENWLAPLVALIASTIGTISQYPALVNDYIINGDVPQHVYWMQQFRDSELFKNDLLTDFAKSIQPWGAIAVYRLLSFISDPLWVSKVLPIVLLVVSSVYVFRLVKYLAGNVTGFIASLLFMIMPVFPGVMAGGTPRAYVYPLLISFLFYLIRKDFFKTSVILLLQPLFYPSIFFVCGLAYFLAFVEMRPFRLVKQHAGRILYFTAAVSLGVALLAGKYLLDQNPNLGTMVTKDQAASWPELSVEGRYAVFPTAPLHEAVIQQTRATFMPLIAYSPIYLALREFKPASLSPGTLKSFIWWSIPFIVLVGVAFLVVEIKRGQVVFPRELLYLLVASAIMYELADLVFLKLWLPSRYIQYSLAVVTLVFVSLAIGRILAKVTRPGMKALASGVVIGILLLHFNINQNAGMDNQSDKKEFFEYLGTLPKNSLIAAYPTLADYIPTFSKRKVFLNQELSQPSHDTYWLSIRARTYEFFDAYYAGDLAKVAKFCDKNHIDYLIVDKRHFSREFLEQRRLYFEPFNSYIKKITRDKSEYALLQNLPKLITFQDGNILVIRVSTLAT